MAFQGSFSKDSGPTGPGPDRPVFGNALRPPSPSPATPAFPGTVPFRSPTLRAVQSPPSWGDSQFNQRPSVVTSVVASRNSGNSVTYKFARSQEAKRIISPPLMRREEENSRIWNQGFSSRAQSPELVSRNNPSVHGFRSPVRAGPIRSASHLVPPRTQSPEMASRNNMFVEGFYPSVGDLSVRPTLSYHTMDGQPQAPVSYANFQARPDQSSVSPYAGSYDSGRSQSNDIQGAKRTRSPTQPSTNAVTRRISHVPQNNSKRPTLSYHTMDGQPQAPVSYADFQARPDQSSVSPYGGSYDSDRSRSDDIQGAKRTRSPTQPSTNAVIDRISHVPQNNSKKPSLAPSPPLDSRSNVTFSPHDSQAPRRSLPSANNSLSEAAVTNSTGLLVVKRTRSPPLHSSIQATEGNSYDIENDTEREMQAKAKRLARFKTELGEKVQSSTDNAQQKVSANRNEMLTVERNRLILDHSTELAGDFTDNEGSGTSSVIIGLCTDMCPESERAERERKGDLDPYERLDGDRNQTSKYLAVKKYTRTAEREANLIRPMPILQKTIDYLLNLLDQPYNNKLLGTYNFLWDRMRAIRMDLRMQHIFNQGAIAMLEQMIKLHIVAMHELCEYPKGEGFSEGFDAHLNIEQMNKTSVELFQLYDDHRKKGINIPTEKEFRGYYALLKLDKHPGYIVEPAELSLDLAKMTPEIRQTKEVLFARDVARACRTGNFIAFFRLARKASYLQACLMHAHFAKLRTQALASLHTGLQNNQGLPVSHIAQWLAMEDEDMESLLEYYGFVIKDFEEPYMVKEGPFINGDKDYPTRRSKLVDMKKSGIIIDDILPSTQVISPTKVPKETNNDLKVLPSAQGEHFSYDIPSKVVSPVSTLDEEIDDFEAVPSPKEHNLVQPVTEMPAVSQQPEDEHQADGFIPFSWERSIPNTPPAKVGDEGKPKYDFSFSSSMTKNMHSFVEEIPFQIVSKTAPEERPPIAPYNFYVENLEPLKRLEDEEPPAADQENKSDETMEDDLYEEIAEAKLKLILRLWKRRTSRQRELREERQLAANAALNSLALGPPVQLKKDQPSTSHEFDIDHVLRERHKNHMQSWSRVNVSEEVGGMLGRRNPDSKCLCWKIIICPQIYKLEVAVADLALRPWLLSKLMPPKIDDENDDLVVSSSGLSIWKKWIPGELGADLTCCLSVVKDANFNNLIETVSGASALVFLVSESIPWNLQKEHLHKLVMSIPSGSCLPLLILSNSFKDEVSDPSSIIVNELGLYNIDKSRISSFMVVSLVENQQKEFLDGFFSDYRLREGLQWLASESPLQLVLHHVRTRELILTHLNPLLEKLNRMRDNEMEPNDCVIAFNEALDRSLANIGHAAKANCTNWPCPEIALLEEFSDEHRIVKMCIPDIGWSSVQRIEPLVSSLKDSKLPIFVDDLSYFARGSSSGREIENQKIEFENSLSRYLAQLGFAHAIREACTLVQSSGLELRGSCFHIVPKWVLIFRRIYQWRLMGLAGGDFSSAYILDSSDVNLAVNGLTELGLEGSRIALSQPSLDEMIEAACSPLPFNFRPLPEADQVLSKMASNGEARVADSMGDFMEEEFGVAQDHRVAAGADDVSNVNGGLGNGSREVMVGKVNGEAEKLSTLLEKCNILQNMIDEKLSVYF
ncbi:hypothetical protein UlMin_009437 [Ulmus minor]